MRKCKDGYYRKDIPYIIDGVKKRKVIRAKTKIELEAKIDEFKESQKKVVKNSDMIFDDYFKIWLEEKSKIIQKNSLERYEYSYKHCEKIKYKKLVDINKNDVQEIIDSLNDKLRVCDYVYLMLNQVFERAIDDELLFKNPCRKIVKTKYKSKKKRALTENEKYIIEHCGYTEEERMYLTLLMYTGCRRGELLALSVDDFDFKNDVIVINKAIAFFDNDPILKEPKTESGNRVVPILDEAKKIYVDFLKGKKGFIFTKSNELYSLSNFRCLWENIIRKSNRFAEQNNLPKVEFTSHIFRHNFATILHSSKVPLKTAQNILGHSDASTTLNIYTHLDKNSINEAKELLNNNLKK